MQHEYSKRSDDAVALFVHHRNFSSSSNNRLPFKHQDYTPSTKTSLRRPIDRRYRPSRQSTHLASSSQSVRCDPVLERFSTQQQHRSKQQAPVLAIIHPTAGIGAFDRRQFILYLPAGFVRPRAAIARRQTTASITKQPWHRNLPWPATGAEHTAFAANGTGVEDRTIGRPLGHLPQVNPSCTGPPRCGEQHANRSCQHKPATPAIPISRHAAIAVGETQQSNSTTIRGVWYRHA